MSLVQEFHTFGEEAEFTALCYLSTLHGQEKTPDGGDSGRLVTSIEFEVLRSSRKCDLIGKWIDQLRALYAICREETNEDMDTYEEVYEQVSKDMLGT